MKHALVLLVLVSACSKKTEAIDAGAPDAGPKVLRPAPPAPRSCASYAACVDACDAGQAAGCYDAALAMLELRVDGGRDLQLVTPLATRACELGDGRGCARSNDARASERLGPQCAGDGGLVTLEACELLSVWQRDHDAGADAANSGARAMAMLEARCANEPWACARLGSALLHGHLGRTEVPRALTLLERACDDGVAGACVEVTLVFLRGMPSAGIEPDPARAAKTGRSARELTQQLP